MEGVLSQKIKLKDKDTTKWKKFYYKLTETKLQKFSQDKNTFIGSIELNKETKVVEFIDYDNTFAEYSEDIATWIRIVNSTIEKIEVKEEVEFKTTVQTENPIAPVTEYLKNSERILFDLCSNYDTLRGELNDTCKQLNELHKKQQLLEDKLFFYRKNSDNNLLLRILQNQFSYKVFEEFAATQRNEEACKFWKEAEIFRQHAPFDSPEKVKKEAQSIFDRYLSDTSMTVLNVTGEKKNMVKNSLENPNPDIFIELQKEMVLSMKLNKL
eukprot:gene7107-11270_t